MAYEALFSPLKIGALTLPNRILMAPLTRCRAEDGHVDGGILDQQSLAGLDLTAQGQDLHPIAGRPHPLQGLLRSMLDLGRRHGLTGRTIKKLLRGMNLRGVISL